MRIAILGDDEFGQAAAQVLKFAPSEGVGYFAERLPETVARAESLQAACEGAQLVVLAGLGGRLLELAKAYGTVATGDQLVLASARSVAPDFELPHETIRKFTCARKIGLVGGPLHAQDLSTQQHVNLVLATRFPEVFETVHELVPESTVTVARSRDLVGVALAGAYGHLASLLAGMGQGLEWNDTSRSMLVAHVLMEARTLALALGAEGSTFQGLVGWGELIPRASVRSDRHIQLGRAVVQGSPLADALRSLDREVEGVDTARWAADAGRRHGLRLHLTETLAEILDGASDPDSRLKRILERPLMLS